MVKRLSAPPKTLTLAAKTGVEEGSRKTTILPSLGMSGAVYGAVTLTTCAFPDTEISLIIPPSYPIPIQYGVGALVTMDIIGVLRGWRFVIASSCQASSLTYCLTDTSTTTRTWEALRSECSTIIMDLLPGMGSDVYARNPLWRLKHRHKRILMRRN